MDEGNWRTLGTNQPTNYPPGINRILGKCEKGKKQKKVRKKVVKKVGRLKIIIIINRKNENKKKMGKCEPATAGCSHEELSVEPVVRPSITGS
jgi:hypothetical protein